MRNPNQSQKKPTFLMRIKAKLEEMATNKIKVNKPDDGETLNRAQKRLGWGWSRTINRTRHIFNLQQKKKKMVHPFPPVKHRKYQHKFEE